MLALVVASTFWSMVAYAGPLGNAVTLSAALDASAAGTTWVLASMSVGLAVTLLAAGVVADALGRARVFALGAMVFAGANLVCAVVGSTWPFVVARVVVGLGAAGMIATGLGLLAAADGDGRHRSTSAVWWSAAMGAGIALGPLLTGVLDRAGAWRWFYVGLALAGTLLYALAGRVLPVEPPAERARRLDLVGFTLLTAFLALLVTAIVQVRAGGPVLAAVLLGGSVLLLVALGLSQRRPQRLVDPGIFTHRPFLGATIAGLGTGLGIIAASSFLCTVLVRAVGLSTFQAAGVLAAWSGTSALAALALVRHGPRIPGRVQLTAGLVGVAVGLVLLAGVGDPVSAWRFVPGLVVCGCASGLLNAGLARQAVATVPGGLAATGTAANNTARYLGAAVGISVASVTAGTDLLAGWNRVALLAAACSLLAALAVAWLSRGERAPGVAGAPTGTWRTAAE